MYVDCLRDAPGKERRNAFGRVFTGDRARELGGDPLERYYMGMTVVCMEGLNAGYVAPSAHDDSLRQ